MFTTPAFQSFEIAFRQVEVASLCGGPCWLLWLTVAEGCSEAAPASAAAGSGACGPTTAIATLSSLSLSESPESFQN